MKKTPLNKSVWVWYGMSGGGSVDMHMVRVSVCACVIPWREVSLPPYVVLKKLQKHRLLKSLGITKMSSKQLVVNDDQG